MISNNVTSSSKYRFQKELHTPRKKTQTYKESYLQVKELGLSSKEILRNLRSKKS